MKHKLFQLGNQIQIIFSSVIQLIPSYSHIQYKNIQHDKLKVAVNKVIDLYFQDRQHNCISKYGETWLNNTNKDNILFDVLKSLVKSLKLAKNGYLRDHCIFIVASLPFRQSIKILIGSDPAPFMSNLFLSTFESKTIKKKK